MLINPNAIMTINPEYAEKIKANIAEMVERGAIKPEWAEHAEACAGELVRSVAEHQHGGLVALGIVAAIIDEFIIA